MLFLRLRHSHTSSTLPRAILSSFGSASFASDSFATSSSTQAAVANQPAPTPPLSRAFTQPLLYRDFIQQSLYHPEFGYFNRPSPPIRRLPQPINFNRLLGQVEYRLELDRAYKQLQVDWLTPVEVFAPWYGRALAHYMLELRKHDASIDSSTPLHIVEVGGGTGTLAASILDYVCEVDAQTYSSMLYTTIEISTSLAAAQQQHILGERRHGSTWQLVRGDASCPSTWAEVDARLPRHHRLCGPHTFVLMMEVLDNLPHDRVVRQDASTPWQQVAVQTVQQPQQQQRQDQLQQEASSRQHRSSQQQQHQQQPQYAELLQPATDPLIQRCLQAVGDAGQHRSSSSSSSSGGGTSAGGLGSWLQRALGLEGDQPDNSNNMWLPTRSLQLLETLHAAVPHHTLIAADFDALPDIQVAGRGAPLVSGRAESGRVVQDYDTVLVPWGAADIFFPTDFDDLGRLYSSAAATAGKARGAATTHPSTAKQRESSSAPPASPTDASTPISGDDAGRAGVSSSHSSTADFMSAFAVEAKHTCTLSGYNPLVQDWLNTRIFVGRSSLLPAAAA